MRRLIYLFLATLLFVELASASDSAAKSHPLIGAWQLISVETVDPRGAVTYPFYGKHPQGLLIYDASGWMSIQIVSDPKPMVPTDDTRAGFIRSPEAERAAAADGYYAYVGTFTVNSVRSTVTHNIRESFYPGERGQTVTRHFSIDKDRLTLIATFREMEEEHQRRLTWTRTTPSPLEN